MKNKMTATLPLALLAIGTLGSVTSANADLNNSIYVPLDAPCRVGDTRNLTPQRVPAGGYVEWFAYGTDMSSQGGEPGGCLQPKIDMAPTGIAVNITAYGPQATGRGNLVAFPADAVTAPTASIVNYYPIPGIPNPNIANSTFVGLCQEGPCDGTFRIQSNNADVPVIADVQGYFYAQPSGIAHVAIRGGDYSSPAAAMSDLDKWCGTPDEFNPCLMKIAPGYYDIGSTPILMQEWVSIQGSGIGSTNLYAELSGSTEGEAVVVGAGNAILSDLSIENYGGAGGEYSTGIYTYSEGFWIDRVDVGVFGEGTNTGILIDDAFGTRIEHVTVKVSDGEENVGISNKDSAFISLMDVSVMADGGVVENVGIINNNTSGITMWRVEVNVFGGEEAVGVVNSGDSTVLMKDAFILVDGSENDSIAVGVNSSEVTMINGAAVARGSDGYAVMIVGNTPASKTLIRDATLEGGDGAGALFISDESPQTRVVNNVIEGVVDNQLTAPAKNMVCRGNYDEDLQDVDCK